MLELSPSNGFGHQLTKSTRKERGTTAYSLRKPNWNVKFSCVIFLSEEEDWSINFPDVSSVDVFPRVLQRSGAWESLNWQEWEPATTFSAVEKSVYCWWKLSQLAPLSKWASWLLKPSGFCPGLGSLPWLSAMCWESMQFWSHLKTNKQTKPNKIIYLRNLFFSYL